MTARTSGRLGDSVFSCHQLVHYRVDAKSIGLTYPCPQLCMFKYPESDGAQHPGHHFVLTVFSPVDSRDVKLDGYEMLQKKE